MSYRSFSPARGGYPAVRHHHRGGLKKHSHPSHHSHLPDRGEWRSSRRSPQYQKENGASSLMSHQVEELQNSLCETNHAMTESEKMLSDYHTANLRQSLEMEELRSELNESRELLASSRGHSPKSPSGCKHSSTCGVCERDEKKVLSSELDREKLARERAEFNSSRMINLLESSLRSHTPAPSTSSREERGEIEGTIRDLKLNLSESTKRIESNNEIYEQRLKEIEDKLREDSLLSKTEGAFEELAQQVSQLKSDLWQREASNKRRSMLQQIKVLENDLASERERHSSSVRQSRKLHSQVKHLGQELGQVKQEKEKALSCLEATSQHLNETLGGKEELLCKLEELQNALASSESRRIACVEKCGELSQECFKQEVCQEALRERIKDVESKVEIYKKERLSLESQHQMLSQELSERTLSECRLRDHCNMLQAQLEELEHVLESTSEEMKGLVWKIESLEKENNQGKVEVVQLKANAQKSENEIESLHVKIRETEEHLHFTTSEFEKLELELKRSLEDLSRCDEERGMMESHLNESKRKYEICHSQKKGLQNRLLKVQQQLEDSEKKQASSNSQAVQAVKKLKARNAQLEQEKVHLQKEKESSQNLNKELQKKLEECQAVVKNDQCRLSQSEQEKSEINAKISSLQSHCEDYRIKNEGLHNQVIDLEAECAEVKNQLEKVKYELSQCCSDKEDQKQEITLLKQNLEQSAKQCQVTEKRLTVQLNHAKELSQSQTAQLQSELEVSRTDKAKFVTKYKKLLGAYQSMKSEFDAHQLQYVHIGEEKTKLEAQLEELQHCIAKKEEEILNKMEAWKVSQNQELKKLKQKHAQVTSKLQKTITSLEMRLADEQMTLCEVKKQQLKVLDDQQKVYADDLTKSLEDTERVRRKYLRAKKVYEDKAASLECEISEFSGENEHLRQKLNESQVSLLQQVEEHESILRAAAVEVDTIVHQMGLRVDVPMFPTIVGDETDIKKWMADMLAKLKWLQKEVTDLLTEENKLRHRVQSTENKVAGDGDHDSTEFSLSLSAS